jgi:hypothetical protein
MMELEIDNPPLTKRRSLKSKWTLYWLNRDIGILSKERDKELDWLIHLDRLLAKRKDHRRELERQ